MFGFKKKTKKKYNRISDLLFGDKRILTNLYEDMSINLEIGKAQEVLVHFEGSFCDVFSGSFDMINGLISQVPDIDYSLWKLGIENFEQFSSCDLYEEKTKNLVGKIEFKIDGKTQHVSAIYKSNFLGDVKMFNAFVNAFCLQYNIDKEEYLHYFDNCHKDFVKKKYADNLKRVEPK